MDHIIGLLNWNKVQVGASLLLKGLWNLNSINYILTIHVSETVCSSSWATLCCSAKGWAVAPVSVLGWPPSPWEFSWMSSGVSYQGREPRELISFHSLRMTSSRVTSASSRENSYVETGSSICQLEIILHLIERLNAKQVLHSSCVPSMWSGYI